MAALLREAELRNQQSRIAALGRGCVKTQNQKLQVGNGSKFNKLRDRKWGFQPKLND